MKNRTRHSDVWKFYISTFFWRLCRCPYRDSGQKKVSQARKIVILELFLSNTQSTLKKIWLSLCDKLKHFQGPVRLNMKQSHALKSRSKVFPWTLNKSLYFCIFLHIQTALCMRIRRHFTKTQLPFSYKICSCKKACIFCQLKPYLDLFKWNA